MQGDWAPQVSKATQNIEQIMIYEQLGAGLRDCCYTHIYKIWRALLAKLHSPLAPSEERVTIISHKKHFDRQPQNPLF